MYTAYYGFREKPFALSPDPRYLFLSDTHREVLGHLVYGIEQGEGFMAITGEVGTGKTTLCRTLLRRLGNDCEVAFLFNPTLTPLELLKAINTEFDLSTFGDSRPELTEVLNHFLFEMKAAGRRVLLIVDEAQNLATETLEQLRLLSNLETETSKLLQIVLLGQPELDQTLARHELRQLRQRITVWWRLGPLGAEETREYIRHRLRVAGALERPVFTDSALRRVHRLTRGVPRLINVLCDRALLAGYAEQRAQIGPATIRRVAHELQPSTQRSNGQRKRWIFSGLGALAAGVAAVFAVAALRPTAPPPAGGGATPDRIDAASAPAAVEPIAPSIATVSPEPEPAVATAPPSAAPSPDAALDAVLLLGPPDRYNATALDALFAAWQLPPSGAASLGFSDMVERLEGRNLRLFQVPAEIDALLREDHPAIVSLRSPDGRLRAAVVRHLANGDADLEGLIVGQTLRVPFSELERRLEGNAYAIWRNYESLPSIMRPGDSGGPVEWLQRSLTRLSFYAGETHGRFDEPTSQAVIAFQVDQHIEIDGQVGPRTQMRLYRALPDYATRSLERASLDLALSR